MKEIDLTNLIPRNSTFKLSQFKDFEFNLSPCTGGKLIEMNQNLGNIEKMLSLVDAVSVSKIAMALMDYKSASKFKKQKVKIIDLNGDEKESEVGGYKLLANCISGLNEQWDIYRAILESLGYEKEKACDLVKELKKGLNEIVNKQLNEDSKKKTKKKIVKKKK